MESVKGVLGRWGKKVAEAAKKTESLAGNTWQHRKFSIFISFWNQIQCLEFRGIKNCS